MSVKTVTFRFKGGTKQLLIPVTIEYVNTDSFIEHQKLYACIDTGATQSGIDAGLAESLDFTTLGTTRQKTAGGIIISGIHTVNLVIGNDMRFDNLEITEINAGVDFIIGMDVLGKGDFIFSHKNNAELFSFRCPTADKGERFVSGGMKLTSGELIP